MKEWHLAYSAVPAILAGVCAGLLVVIDDRRWALITLGGQYACVAWLCALSLTLPVATAKLLAGWMSTLVLVITLRRAGWPTARPLGEAIPTGLAFRMLATLLVTTAVLGLGQVNWLSLPQVQPAAVSGGILLVGLGLLQLGLTEEALRVGLGLLTMISGFEAVYSALEPSLAMVGLLAAVHIGIALAISYLLASRVREVQLGEDT